MSLFLSLIWIALPFQVCFTLVAFEISFEMAKCEGCLKRKKKWMLNDAEIVFEWSIERTRMASIRLDLLANVGGPRTEGNVIGTRNRWPEKWLDGFSLDVEKRCLRTRACPSMFTFSFGVRFEQIEKAGQCDFFYERANKKKIKKRQK